MNKTVEFSTGVKLTFGKLDKRKFGMFRELDIETPLYYSKNGRPNRNHPDYKKQVELDRIKTRTVQIEFVLYHALVEAESPEGVPAWDSEEFRDELQHDYALNPENNLKLFSWWLDLYAYPERDESEEDSDYISNYQKAVRDMVEIAMEAAGLSEKKSANESTK
ncbi:hypothetical protein N9137_01120 [Pseudomonadales bacterium]|nr:hypothetical protein [Pseudomonadales bacterium]